MQLEAKSKRNTIASKQSDQLFYSLFIKNMFYWDGDVQIKRADKKNDLGFWHVFEEKSYDWVWITGSTSLGCAFTNEIRQGWAAVHV